MKFYRDLFDKYVVAPLIPAIIKLERGAVECGKTVLGVAAAGACLSAAGYVTYMLASFAQQFALAKGVVFGAAVLGALYLILSLAYAFARDDYDNRARLIRCVFGGMACTLAIVVVTAGLFGPVVPAAALALFGIFQAVTVARYVEVLPLNWVLPEAVL